MYGATKNELTNGTDAKQPDDIDVKITSVFTIFGFSDNGTEIHIMYYPESDQNSDEEDEEGYTIDSDNDLTLEDVVEDTERQQRENQEEEEIDEDRFGDFTE